MIGDNKHGDKAYNRWAAARLGERHMFLRASELTFTHPSSGERVTFRLPLPDLWKQALKSFAVEPMPG